MIDDHFEQNPLPLICKLRSLRNAIKSLRTQLGLECRYLSDNSDNIDNSPIEIESDIYDCLLEVQSQFTLVSSRCQRSVIQVDTSQLTLIKQDNIELQTNYIELPDKIQKQVELPENTENIAKKDIWQIEENSRLNN